MREPLMFVYAYFSVIAVFSVKYCMLVIIYASFSCNNHSEWQILSLCILFYYLIICYSHTFIFFNEVFTICTIVVNLSYMKYSLLVKYDELKYFFLFSVVIKLFALYTNILVSGVAHFSIIHSCFYENLFKFTVKSPVY